MKFENTLWVEKYRPKKIEQLVLPDEYRQAFYSCIKNKDIGNFLFSGPAGGGKTTAARILASPNGVLINRSDNLLEINGSAKETRGISFVSDVIEPFLRIPAAGVDSFKIVFIDEGDYLTEASFRSLRGIIEKYSSVGRFIITCNYLSKIPDEIQSRFQPYIFKQVSLDYIIEYANKILNAEKLSYEEKDVKFIVNGLYPDIRRIVNALQKSSTTGTLKPNRDIVLTNEKVMISTILDIIDKIKNNDHNKIGQPIKTIGELLSSQDLEFRSIYMNLFNNEEVPIPAKIKINKAANEHTGCLIPAMHFMNLVFEIISTLKEYQSRTK